MVNVEEAKAIINSNTSVLESEIIGLQKSLGRVLSSDIFAPINMPPFPQSAMDGYALCFGEEKMNTFKLKGVVQAGSANFVTLQSGEAVRIFTGAPVPKGASAVVMQEKAKAKDGCVVIDEVRIGENIRTVGEQIAKGSLAIKKGTILNPGVIGFMAMLGLVEVRIVKLPKITLLVTGNELISPGNELAYGQIYESNSAMLFAVLNSTGFSAIECVHVKDKFESTKKTIKKALQNSDVILISGGISVGDFDFVGSALDSLDVKSLFYKVNQKPGKPLYYGKYENKAIFALPGNPSAALTCFYHYVLPALRKMAGKGFVSLNRIRLPLTKKYIKPIGRAHFLKAKTNGREVEILEGQSSAMLRSFTESNAFVYIPSETVEVEAGELVEVDLLD